MVLTGRNMCDQLVTLPAHASRGGQIDGTKGFLRGGDAQYAIGLALLDTSVAEPVLGVLALPNWQLPPASPSQRGIVMAASRGGGK